MAGQICPVGGRDRELVDEINYSKYCREREVTGGGDVAQTSAAEQE